MWLPRGRPAAPTADAVLGVAWACAALLASMGLPAALWAGHPASAAGGLLPLAVAVLALARPLEAVLVVAALAPVSGVLETLVGGRHDVTALWLPALLLGAALRFPRTSLSLRAVPRAALGGGLLLALLALASAAVQAESAMLFSESRSEWLRALVAASARSSGGGPWNGVSQGLALAQMALAALLVAASVTTDDDAARVRRMLLAGATAAAAFNVAFLVSGALRNGDGVAGAWALAGRARISAAFPDVNAAGSFFACMLALAVGAAYAAWRRRARAGLSWYVVSAALLSAGLVLAGSRVAVASLPLGFAVAAVARAPRRTWSTGRRAALVGAALVAAVLLAAVADVRRGVGDSSSATFIRTEFARTTWRMLSDHPLFGVGAGQYREASGRYSSEALKRIYETQNAHNNFLQVAGELGPFALAAFVLLVGLPAVMLWRKVGDAPGVVGVTTLAGLTAFLLTCLGGHPLLVAEVRTWFAVFLGLALAVPLLPSPGRIESTSAGRVAAWTIVLSATVLVWTLPARVRADEQQTPLEHVVLGDARWVREHGGEPQITFRGHLTMYAPASGTVLLTVRRAPRQPRRPIELQLSLDGLAANAIALDGGAWVDVPLLVPKKGPLAFRRLTLEARWRESARAGAPKIQVRRIRQSR